MLINLSPITFFWARSTTQLKPLSLLPQTHYYHLEAILGFCSCVYQHPDSPLQFILHSRRILGDVRDFQEFKSYLATGSSSIVDSQKGEKTHGFILLFFLHTSHATLQGIDF